MSILLSIETSTSALSVALFKEGVLIQELFELPPTAKHTEHLLPLINRLLSEQSLSLDGISGIALPKGPGSYTSLRVGLATAMGLYSRNPLPIFPVSTLQAMAFGMRDFGEYLIPVLKAGRGLLMGGIYKGRDLSLILPEGPYSADDFLREVKKLSGPLAFGGPGLETLSPLMGGISSALSWPRARHVGELALEAKIPPVPAHEVRLEYFLEALSH